MIKVSVIVPFKNAKETLSECVEHLINDQYPDKEITLVDDGSEDQAHFSIQENHNVRLIRLEESHGPAYCRNLGAKKATGDVLIFIDADILVLPGTIGQFVNSLRENPEAAAVVGMLSDQCLYTNLCSCFFNLRKHFDYLSIKNKYITAFYSAICSIRKSVFDQYGGFSEGYDKATVEDAELATRLLAGNEKIILNKEIRVLHKKHHTLTSLLKSDFDRAILFGKLLVKKKMVKTVAKKKRFFSFRLNSIISSLLSLTILAMIPFIIIDYRLIVFMILMISLVFVLNDRFLRLAFENIRKPSGILFPLLLVLDAAVVGLGAIVGVLKSIVEKDPVSPDKKMKRMNI